MAAVSRAVQAAADTQLGQLERLGALGAASAAAVRSKLAEARALAPAPPLPPPMVPGNYEANATSCHLQVSLSSFFFTPATAGGDEPAGNGT
jgi:hypothetical protein